MQVSDKKTEMNNGLLDTKYTKQECKCIRTIMVLYNAKEYT
jgi:hypothetical protein